MQEPFASIFVGSPDERNPNKSPRKRLFRTDRTTVYVSRRRRMIAYRQAPESEYVIPTIVLLREHIETIRRGEIDRARRRLGKLSAEQEKAIELLTHGIINEILHGPITALKASAEKDPSVASVAVEMVHRIFDLGGKHKRENRR
jgi:glutamyl-tRNA reductase